jgi:hypothetical protein
VYTLSRPEAEKLILVIRVLSSFWITRRMRDSSSCRLRVKDGKLFIASHELQNTSGTEGKASAIQVARKLAMALREVCGSTETIRVSGEPVLVQEEE